MSSERANPFADLADDFKPQTKPRPVDPAALAQLSEETGFPSRRAAWSKPPAEPAPAGRRRRRYTTGRNQQINIKATDATIERLYRIADERTEAEKRPVPLGEVLELALDALERAQVRGT